MGETRSIRSLDVADRPTTDGARADGSGERSSPEARSWGREHADAIRAPGARGRGSATTDAWPPLGRQLLLQTWFSASFPTGAYAFGHGLEAAIADGAVRDAEGLADWVGAVLELGGGRDDAIVASVTYRAVRDGDAAKAAEANAVALAFVAGAERLAETMAQGHAFADAVRAAPDVAARLDAVLAGSPLAAAFVGADRGGGEGATRPGREPLALPVAVGAAAAACAIPLATVLACQLHAFGANLVWIGARLLPCGQRAALGAIADLAAPIRRAVDASAAATLDELGGCALLGDVASLRHERLVTRLCLS